MSSSSRNGGPQTANAGNVRSRDPLCRSREKNTRCLISLVTSSTGLKLGIALLPYATISVKPRGGGGGGPRAYVGHLTSRDPYHVPDILDLKRGWTGINNAHAIFRMHNLF